MCNVNQNLSKISLFHGQVRIFFDIVILYMQLETEWMYASEALEYLFLMLPCKSMKGILVLRKKSFRRSTFLSTQSYS